MKSAVGDLCHMKKRYTNKSPSLSLKSNLAHLAQALQPLRSDDTTGTSPQTVSEQVHAILDTNLTGIHCSSAVTAPAWLIFNAFELAAAGHSRCLKMTQLGQKELRFS